MGFAGQTWVLDVCVLATIARGDSHGYQIVKGAPTALGLSESTLYPILRRLKASGHVTEYAQEHNGRTRKYYSITPQGCGLGAVPLACYSASCGALAEGLFSGGGMLVGGVLLVVAAVSAIVALTLGVPEPSLFPALPDAQTSFGILHFATDGITLG